MSRRMDREGVLRSETQGIQNRRFWADPRCVEDARGWLQPFAVWQGWDEYNHAAYALYCLLIFRSMALKSHGPVIREDGSIGRDELHGIMIRMRREDELRRFRWHIERSRKCDRPAIP